MLRFIDLWDNAIGEKGIKIMFDSARKNRSIMYVTQRQNGSMIEGHRELGSRRQVVPGETAAERPDSITPTSAFALTSATRRPRVMTDTMFEQVDYPISSTSTQRFELGAVGGHPGVSVQGRIAPVLGVRSTWGMGSPGGPNTPYGAMSPGGYPPACMLDLRPPQEGAGKPHRVVGSSGVIKQVEEEPGNKDNKAKKAGGSVLKAPQPRNP